MLVSFISSSLRGRWGCGAVEMIYIHMEYSIARLESFPESHLANTLSLFLSVSLFLYFLSSPIIHTENVLDMCLRLEASASRLG